MKRAHIPAVIIALCSLCAIAHSSPQKGAESKGAANSHAAAVERGKKLFMLNECNYCHGLDLTHLPRGSVADLKHNPLVGQDVNGNLIGASVLAGIPDSQTSMPRYAGVISKDQIPDLAAYIHFERQQGRYKELSKLSLVGGDAVAGERYFLGAGKCNSCHSPSGDLLHIATKYDLQRLRRQLLRPQDSLSRGHDSEAGRRAHSQLLERYTDAETKNLLAYLETLK